MTHVPRPAPASRYAFAALALVLVGGLASLPAHAEMREFTGRVSEVTSSELVVGNRMGDELTFARSKRTRVRGAKGDWASIQPEDHVTVHWSFQDKPRQARRVVVLPH